MSKSYMINEVFYSIQGEGARTGTPNTFVRFTGCNMQCAMEEGKLSPGGFDCDTEFASGTKHTAESLLAWVEQVSGGKCKNIIFTGGEPLLQLDDALCAFLRGKGYYLAVETNGSLPVPRREDDAQKYIVDWITVSPKVAEHCVRQPVADEVRYVRSVGQGIPKPKCHARHQLVSPAFFGDTPVEDNIKHCVQLVRDNPEWSLSLQTHKLLQVR
jgi:7-carboxy-7-deazaguanine synthase